MSLTRSLKWAAAAGAAAAAYMLFEAQWLVRREEWLAVPGLPKAVEGLSILHLTDVHAGQPGLNLWNLKKAVSWAATRRPDLVVLTGDILGGGRGARECLDLLATLDPPLGMFAVTGNHEHGLSKNPFARLPAPIDWERAGITLLEDRCVAVHRNGSEGPAGEGRLVICGADYVTGGHRLEGQAPGESDFSLLLVHRPPEPDDPLARRFPLIFAGHTHGGQIRVPTPKGPVAVHPSGLPYEAGIHASENGLMVISTGIGTTFLPFRLMTRPEVVLYRLSGVGRG